MRALLLSTYPPYRPMHGGQHRLNQIARHLGQAGYQVESRGILGSDSYPASPGFLPYPGTKRLAKYLADPTLMEDWALGRYAADPAGGRSQLLAACPGDYDLIFCEQPWLFEFAGLVRDRQRNRAVKLVYGSQNIEHRLKHSIVSRYLGHATAEAHEGLVLETERRAIAEADLVVTVSEDDADWTREQRDGPVAVAPNGVEDRRASLADVAQSNALGGTGKFALYCASSHPPNIEGFFDMFGDGIGCFGPLESLIIAGPAGPVITADSRARATSGVVSKVRAPGMVTEAQLRGLLATAHVVILPITQGGGTNLKTAEALWTGAHVVATPTAMRGFEAYEKAQGVHLADRGPAFQRAIRMTLDQPPNRLSRDQRLERMPVLWSSTLQPMIEALRGVDA